VSPTVPARTVRRDIQGLRAVAVALVVAYHLWPAAIPGGFVGVDVFFVISGFLITAHLLQTPPTSRRALGQFWARRIRRLLPASLLVIASTLAAARLVSPSTEWARTAREAIASTLYVENWALAGSATDYLATDQAASPFQHFWSLGVEEQFYLFWPLLLAAAFWLATGRSTNRQAAGGAIAVVVIASFAYSIVLTARDPAAAYFVTPTRMWELGAGGLLAVLAPRISMGGWRASAVAWFGLLAIGVGAFTLSGSDPFPGWRASIPVIGAVAFLAADSQDRSGPVSVLARRPVQWLGDVSYSVYLWHWPLIVLTPFALDRDLRTVDRIGIVALMLVLSALSYTHVEQRWRRAPAGGRLRRSYLAAAVAMSVVALAGVAQATEVSVRDDRATDRAEVVSRSAGECLGAGALAYPDACDDNPSATPVLPPASAAKDRAPTFANRCFETPPYRETPSCTFGTGDLQIALVGNSHSAHWQPAFSGLPEATVTTFLASECTTVDSVLLTFDAKVKATGCQQWSERVFDRTQGTRFDLIVTSQRNVHDIVGHTGADSVKTLKDAYRRYLQRWTDSGAQVLVLRDTPFPQDDIGPVPACLARSGDEADACSGDPSDWIPTDPLAEATADVPGATVANLNQYICEPAVCLPVNGRVITYVDGSHLTETYARSLGPFLADAVRAKVSRSGRPR